MDYGHTNPQGFGSQSPEDQAFFTAGVGNTPASESAVDNVENLNTNQDSWVNSSEHNIAAIGGTAITSSEAPLDTMTQPLPEFGVVMPGAPQTNEAPVADTIDNALGGKKEHYDSSAIYTEGDHLNKDAVKIIDNDQSEFIQDDNANNFYNKIRGYVKIHAKNSWDVNIGEKVA